MDLTNTNDHALVTDWQLSRTLRQRKKQAHERRNLAALQTQQKRIVNSQAMRPRGQKLPPLPKDDYKIVTRPHQGLPLKAITAPALARPIIEACDNQFTDETFVLRINQGSNIAILSTKYSEVVQPVRKLQQLAINEMPHPVRAYMVTGKEALHGVVHEEEDALKLGGRSARTPSNSRSRSKHRPQATKAIKQEAQQPSQATPFKKHNEQQQQGMKTPDLKFITVTQPGGRR
ncbi:hypothetical protein HPB52_021417 [Rhipicephalus sanguineus]|uniref:Uncharacterized protein n=1 Tax=Rhipicephalus sanguineus TaxID=34632 RepID=A0A9D4SN99_RHISA|nr:hypothetical protein HPB52_021417 [Rhipicephalus sanguineus]